MKRVIPILFFFILFGYGQSKIDNNPIAITSPVNLSHALSLVDSMNINGTVITYIWIYADAPGYNPVGAEGEGIACVDDVGRFMEVLETEILIYNNRELIPIARGMTQFLLYMSRDDGLWYNFMLDDGSINTTHKNSAADFGWWAVRGLRGLAAAYKIFANDPDHTELLSKVIARINAADSHIQTALQRYPNKKMINLDMRPAWLIKDAPDLNSELLIALSKLHNTGNFDYYDAINKISVGLIDYQYQAARDELNGMYFCWKNIWHNWGNNQAYGLIEAYKITTDSRLLSSVKIWADSFVPFLIENNFPWEITISSPGHYEMTPAPQIAYGINSIYHGLKSLAALENNVEYSELSERVFMWFKGDNIAQTQIYDSETGRCFDGINGMLSVNKNSGAESTIECLLAIQARRAF
ncbi:MAG TPA: hypothetical protein ENH49_01110 [Candidatus Marinimicrobia bacterium]|nr:hypothetical protein [Candidatus Neomarinimicrobiota bacterium]